MNVPEEYWRIIKGSKTSEDDFKSNDALGIPPPNNDSQTVWLNSGISLWATENHARKKAQRYARLGSHLVALVILDSDPEVAINKTLGRGHYTAWGVPSVLLARVTPGSERPV